MTENEAICVLIRSYSYSLNDQVKALKIAIKALEEIQEYRKIGTVEELKTAQKYIDLARKHDTIGKVIEACAEYESIGTVEEVRESVEKTKAKKCIQDSCPDHTRYKCPSCGKIQMSEYKRGIRILGRIPNNCDNCGQRLESEE